MITDDVPVLAARACDQHRAVVVALFRDLVLGADPAGFTSEDEMITWLGFGEKKSSFGLGGRRVPPV